MIEIIPAVIPRTARDVRAVGDVIAHRPLSMHIDYVGRAYGGQPGSEFLPTADMLSRGVFYEAHIMERDKGRLLAHFAELQIGRVIFQYEAFVEAHEIEELAHTAHAHGIEVGVAFLIDTPLRVLEGLKNFIDGVQLMSIAEIGAQGRAFDERVYERIRSVKEAYRMQVAVDGGITLAQVPLLKSAGADRLVVGSAIVQQPDPYVAFKNFLAAAA